MKAILIILGMIYLGNVYASEKNEAQLLAKGIQCTYLREKSFFNIDELYSVEKSNAEYIKKVSDSIYAQAFKICDPENTANADKEILAVCTSGCDQLVTKGVLGIGGVSKTDIEKCKKMCLDYSDHLSHHYTAAAKAVKKYIEMNPPAPTAPTTPLVSPDSKEKEKEKEKEKI
jgi:hypothetical protein